MSEASTRDYGGSCNCYHSHGDIYTRLQKLEKTWEPLTDKDDIIFEQKQEIERLNNKLDDIGRTLKPLLERKEVT